MRFSIVASALVAALVGFGSTLPIIVQATRHLGATPAQTASWVAALCLGMGLSSAWLSTRYRMPIVTAWSLAGAVLIIATPSGTTLGHAIAAAMFSAALTMLAGIVPALGALISRLPASIAGGMLAGLLLRFTLDLFGGVQTAPALVLPLVAIFLVARLWNAAFAPLVVIVVALPLAALEGYALPGLAASWPTLAWMPPELSLPSLVSLGIPLFLVTMATQQISGIAVLRTSGYTPPVGPSFIVTGLCYLVFALGGAALANAIVALPPILISAIAGVALLGPLSNALASALSRDEQRFAAILAFLVTASNLTLFGIGGAFWGLFAGLTTLGLERLARFRPR